MPVLSVCVPTCNRRAFLERALRSVVATRRGAASQVEVVVSDNSSDDHSRSVAERVLDGWAGRWHYHRHQPAVGMVGNFNKCVELASGRWVLILHDDDYLLAGGVGRLLEGIRRAHKEDRALLFGVRVVDASDRLLRPQIFPRERVLSPERALSRLLSRSSFVRFPAIVVRRDAYAAAGEFDEAVGGFTDVDMWRRVLGTWGVRLLPLVTAAYVVHPDADTETVFTPQAVDRMMTVFDRVVGQQRLPEREIRACQCHWFHQFILAGTFRRLRAGDLAGAKAVMQLFDLPSIRRLGISGRWLPVRTLMSGVRLAARAPRFAEP